MILRCGNSNAACTLPWIGISPDAIHSFSCAGKGGGGVLVEMVLIESVFFFLSYCDWILYRFLERFGYSDRHRRYALLLTRMKVFLVENDSLGVIIDQKNA